MPDRLSEIDIGLLTAFEALIQERNVSRAAIRLNITQSALSGRLARLRTLFGDQLFLPVAGRGVSPTPRAEELSRALPQLLNDLRDFIGPSSSFIPAESDRKFVLAAYDSPAIMLGPDIIIALKSLAPNIQITFVLPHLETIPQALERGDIDLVIGLPQVMSDGLIGRALFADQFLTAQRHNHPRGTQPITLDEFCAAEHIIVSTVGGGFTGTVDCALAKLNRARRVSLSVQSYALAPIVLASSNHLCTLPARFLKRFESMLDLFSPPIDVGSIELYALWHPRMRDDPAHSWLRNQVFEIAKVIPQKTY